MALIVKKFGGTSVGDLDRIRNVARIVSKSHDAGNKIVVVLSAMSGVTDKLLQMAYEVSEAPDKRELDVLLTTGEQTTIALLAMTLKDLGYNARSILGFQADVRTTNTFGSARIKSIKADWIQKLLDEGNIVVVAGFQGWDEEDNITTLGRGGSDTSAVALAAALNADRCDIYTDVDGVYTTDPNMCPKARKLKVINYDEMLEMASIGAKVLQIRSVEFAKKYNVPVQVRSSFHPQEEGTMVLQESADMERLVVSGVTYSKKDARITIKEVPDHPGVAAKIFTAIAAVGISVDMIIQNTRESGNTDLTFTVDRANFKEALSIAEKIGREIGAGNVVGDTNIAKVSVTGVGMRSHQGVASTMFTALSKNGINILMISTSEIRISCVIEEKYTELAVRELHSAFGLDAE